MLCLVRPAFVFAWIITAFQAHSVEAAELRFVRLFRVTPASGWKFVIGDFIKDESNPAREIAALNTNDGSIWVWKTGPAVGSLIPLRYATVSPLAGRIRFASGQFTGNPDSSTNGHDIFLYYPSDGSVWVGNNTGSAFHKITQWETTVPASGWSFSTGYFDGDSLSDAVAYHPSDGTVWVMANRSGYFKSTIWGHVKPASGWTIVGTGSFGGFGWDVVLYRPADGRILLGQNASSAFFLNNVATMPDSENWTFTTYNHFGLTDLVGYNYQTRSFSLTQHGFSSPDFKFTPIASNLPAGPKWRFTAGYLTTTDTIGENILAYNPGNGSVWIGTYVP